MTNAFRDARVALRLLLRNPGFTAVAVLTLALGVGGNTAIFSVIYATFFETLPYRDADRLVMVWSQHRRADGRDMVAPRDFVEWKRQATAFEDLNAWNGWVTTVSFGERSEQLQIGPATPGFLPMLGYGHPLALGRDFLEEEGAPGKHQVVILTHRIWRERFGLDPNVLGRQIRIDRKPYTIVGVLGAGPPDVNQNQLWVPLPFTPEQLSADSRWLLVMGRLKAGVTLEQANADLESVSRNISTSLRPSAAEWTATVQPFRNNFLSGETKRGLWLLLGAVGFVLLIACANVANLLLARGTARQREVAIRTSIGASPAQIVRQLLIESVVLALIGGALGVALASGLLQVVIALMPPYMLPTEANVRLNIPVLLFTLGACGLCGLVFGAAPAWQALRVDVQATLKETGRALTASGHWLRRVLVVAEFALALTLLAGGGLAIQNLFSLMNRSLGFRPDHLLTFTVPADEDQYTEPAQITAFYRQLIERVQALPGVISASVSTGIPLRDSWGRTRFSVAGQPAVDPAQRPAVQVRRATPGFFDTFGVLITRGRVFTEHDQAGAVPVVIVNETFVTRYLPNVDPLTQRLLFELTIPGQTAASRPVEWQVVGVYSDIASADSVNERVPEIQVPFWQRPWPFVTMAVRTAGEPAGVQQGIAAILQSLNPDVPMARVKTMERVVSEALVRDRFNTVLFGCFAIVGLVLAAFGIYGVMSFAVAQRTHEIGVRIALGAKHSHILRDVIAEGMITALAGTVLGSVGAFYVTQLMRGLVAAVSDTDPLAFVIVTAVLLSAALVACIVPAARAASVEPMDALRQG